MNNEKVIADLKAEFEQYIVVITERTAFELQYVGTRKGKVLTLKEIIIDLKLNMEVNEKKRIYRVI